MLPLGATQFFTVHLEGVEPSRPKALTPQISVAAITPQTHRTPGGTRTLTSEDTSS